MSDVTYSQVWWYTQHMWPIPIWWPILRIRALHLPIQVHTHTHTNTRGAVGSHLCCGTQGAVGGLVPCSHTHTHTHGAVGSPLCCGTQGAVGGLVPCSHTHTHTHGAVGSPLCCGTQGAVGGLVPCTRASRRGIEGGESTVHSLPSPTIPAGPRLELLLTTFQLRVRLSTIRPRLPHVEGYLSCLDTNYDLHWGVCKGIGGY